MSALLVMPTRNKIAAPGSLARGSEKNAGRLLIVDDDPDVVETLLRLLENEGYVCDTANTARAALVRLTDAVDLVLTDIRMPGMDGIALLTHIMAETPETAVVIMSGSGDIAAAVEAMRLGAYDYLNKPFNVEDLFVRIQRALERQRLIRENRHYQRKLEGIVEQQWGELSLAVHELRQTYHATLEALTAALDLRDKETEGHSRRVTEYATVIARTMGLDGEAIGVIRQGALLHDVGKIGIPDSMLHKPGPLSPDEWDLMRRHPQIGYDLLRGIEFLDGAASTIVLYHHERYDGAGYPGKLAGGDIPLGARIFAVADTLDALTADRVYRKATSLEAAQQEIVRCSGTQFDPAIVNIFISIPKQTWHTIQNAVTVLNAPIQEHPFRHSVSEGNRGEACASQLE